MRCSKSSSDENPPPVLLLIRGGLLTHNAAGKIPNYGGNSSVTA